MSARPLWDVIASSVRKSKETCGRIGSVNCMMDLSPPKNFLILGGWFQAVLAAHHGFTLH